MHRVRVRGIYATALSLLLAERGFLLSDVSDVMRSRLKAPVSEAPPEVTVKSLEDSPDEVLVVGYPWEAGVEVERAIMESVAYASARRGRWGLYTVVDVRSLGGCRVEMPGGGEGELAESPCPGEGEVLRATVVKEALEHGSRPRLRRGVSVVGSYAIVTVPGSGVGFSEHIRDQDLKADLMLGAVSRVDTRRAHVRFRSSARSGSVEAVLAEVSRLYEEALRLAGEEPGEPRVVRRGEYISILYMPMPAKRVLDDLRARLVATIKFHHTLKAGGHSESMIVDYAESALSQGSCSVDAGVSALGFVAERMKGRGRVSIIHHVPDGRRYTLGPYRVESIAASGECVRIRMQRTFKSHGVLDGLGVEKRPGDMGITEVDTCSWITLHTYTTPEGKVLGYYANINAPPEVSMTGVRYLDLYVDVVKRPGEDPRIIDKEELDEAYRKGIVSEDLWSEALKWVEKARNKLASMG